jgi:hypothetical protein
MNTPNLLKLLSLIIAAASLASCSMLDHRDFQDEMSEFRDDGGSSFEPNIDFPVVAGDTGEMGTDLEMIRRRTPASRTQRKLNDYELSLKGELYSLEASLDEQEQRKYIQFKDKLGSDSQKIYYLSLDPLERGDYLVTRGLVDNKRNSYYTHGERAIASITNDVVIGMHKSEVSRVWGEPARRDFSGDKREENERWAYRRNDKIKFIYFNGGMVEGWTEE